MIRMQEPSLCINSHDVPGPRYKMWRTVELAAGHGIREVISEIIHANTQSAASGGRGLRNIVINCHGYPGGLWVGGEADLDHKINRENVLLFEAVRRLNVGPIWLVACRAARGADGIDFCKKLAAAASTLVIASDDYQDVGVWGTVRYYTTPVSGLIDEFEGTVHIFKANGSYSTAEDPSDAVYSTY
jgi:hypothetical protein